VHSQQGTVLQFGGLGKVLKTPHQKEVSMLKCYTWSGRTQTEWNTSATSTHQYRNLLSEAKNTTKKNTEALAEASMEVCLEVFYEKLVSRSV